MKITEKFVLEQLKKRKLGLALQSYNKCVLEWLRKNGLWFYPHKNEYGEIIGEVSMESCL